jgi:metal-responsive CopG/Arc/MetJ family transcriptional regulator
MARRQTKPKTQQTIVPVSMSQELAEILQAQADEQTGCNRSLLIRKALEAFGISEVKQSKK